MHGSSILPDSEPRTSQDIPSDDDLDIIEPQFDMNGQPMMTRMNTAGYTQDGGKKFQVESKLRTQAYSILHQLAYMHCCLN